MYDNYGFSSISFIATPEMGVCSERGLRPLSFSFPFSHIGFFVLDWKKLCERGIKGVRLIIDQMQTEPDRFLVDTEFSALIQ
jgi:hypothetical protein